MALKNIKSGGIVASQVETESAKLLIEKLQLQPHIEGGYFVETDRSRDLVANPYYNNNSNNNNNNNNNNNEDQDRHRSFSTLIYYLLTSVSPIGRFHRNKSRTIHLLHQGRARYVVIHPDGELETFTVGHDVANGEKLQWIVEGGDYKASFLISNEECLISEVVVPGFDYKDHNFMSSRDELVGLIGEERASEWDWLLRPN
ncbi:RmlC-like cupin domain-containing protein [Lipomyces japonicus]|uniref:RmlC-like cupin domain-containing protein n=1 Tax=Lipomyces japonicus TaxID=56871 RepID=UPI0034CDD166